MGWPSIVQMILGDGFHPDSGQTPAFIAVASAYKPNISEAPSVAVICKLLLEHGANPKVKNTAGFTALDIAIYTGATRVIDIYVEADCGVGSINAPTGVEQPNGLGNTALMCAAAISHPAALQYLLNEGADPSVKNKRGQVAMDMVGSANNTSSAASTECRAMLNPANPATAYSTQHVGEPWYVANMDRTACKAAVTSGNPGDFLVRDASNGKKMVIVLCGRGHAETANYQIISGDNYMYIVSGVPYRHVSDVLQSMREKDPNGNDGKPLPLGKPALSVR